MSFDILRYNKHEQTMKQYQVGMVVRFINQGDDTPYIGRIIQIRKNEVIVSYERDGFKLWQAIRVTH